MRTSTHKTPALVLATVVMLTVSGCSTEQTTQVEDVLDSIVVENRADADVTVQFDEEGSGRFVAPKDGLSIRGEIAGCYEGPITVTYTDGSTVEVMEPICAGSTPIVRDATARVVDTA